MQELLPVICCIVGDVVFVFQQDNALGGYETAKSVNNNIAT